MNKRHAKPTTAQMISRIYRRQFRFEESIRACFDQYAINALEAEHSIAAASRQVLGDVHNRLRSLDMRLGEIHINMANDAVMVRARHHVEMKIILDHCQRLLREKETLQRMVALHEVNRYMAEPIRRRVI